MTVKLNFHTPPANQGQIVVVSYAMVGQCVIRQTYDQSDRSTVYAISRALSDDEGDYWNGAPANKRWREISEGEVALAAATDWENMEVDHA